MDKGRGNTMWILGTLFRLLLQLIELVLLLGWTLVKGLARLLGLWGWQRVTTGEEYELFAARYLKEQGFRILEHPGGSGDLGVDLVAKKGMKTYAVQCKFYSYPVDGSAVQQVVAGMACYGCNAALVVTNSTLTPGAWTLARRNGVEVLEEVAPMDDPAALTVERLLSPARLSVFALGTLGALLVWREPVFAPLRAQTAWAVGLTLGSFAVAALAVALLRLFWRGVTGNLL